MMEEPGARAGYRIGMCCNVCYCLACLGLIIWGIVWLATIEPGANPTGMWVMVLVLTCSFLGCCSAIVIQVTTNKEEAAVSAFEDAMEGLTPTQMFIKDTLRAPWKVMLSLMGIFSLIILGGLGLGGVFTNMPHGVALAALITGCSLLCCAICNSICALALLNRMAQMD